MGITRYEDWPGRLDRALTAARRTPFAWGRADCGLFMADCILAMTGYDPAAGLRGRYKTRRGAAGALKRYAAGGLAEAMDKALGAAGWIDALPAFAQRGDAVLFAATDVDFGTPTAAAGICIGQRLAYLGPSGLAQAPMTCVTRIWRIG